MKVIKHRHLSNEIKNLYTKTFGGAAFLSILRSFTCGLIYGLSGHVPCAHKGLHGLTPIILAMHPLIILANNLLPKHCWSP